MKDLEHTHLLTFCFPLPTVCKSCWFFLVGSDICCSLHQRTPVCFSVCVQCKTTTSRSEAPSCLDPIDAAKTRVGINQDNSSWICRPAGSGSFSNLCLFAFGLNQEVIQDELFGPIRGLACLVFAAAAAAAGGRGCNHSSRGGGPWRLIGNGPPVNVNGNQWFKSALIDSIHRPSTQDKLSTAVTLPWPLPPHALLHRQAARTAAN